MISVNRVVPRSLQISYAARNSLTGNFKSAIKQQGVTTEHSWLVAKGANSSSKNLSEAWDSYLASKGFNSGSLKSRMKSFFTTGTQA